VISAGTQMTTEGFGCNNASKNERLFVTFLIK